VTHTEYTDFFEHSPNSRLLSFVQTALIYYNIQPSALHTVYYRCINQENRHTIIRGLIS